MKTTPPPTNGNAPMRSSAPSPAAEGSSRGLSLRKNFSWTLAGNILYAACQWGMVTLLVKLGDPAVVGRLSLGLAVTAPIFMFSNLQLRALQATETTGALAFADFAGVRLATTAIATLTSALIAWFGGYGPELTWTIFGLGIVRAVDSLSDVIHGDLQQKERMDRLAASMMLRGPISVGALAAAFSWTGSLPFSVLAMAAGNSLVFFAFDLPNLLRFTATSIPRRSLLPRFEWSSIRKILADALPLGAVMMLISLNTNIPRYFIEAEAGEYALGLFTPLAQLVIAGGLVVNALGQSAAPRLAKLFAAGDRNGFLRLVWIMVGMAAVLCLAGVALVKVAGAEILTLIYSEEYARHTPLLLLFTLLAGLQFAGSFVGYAMTAARRYRVQLPLFVVVTLVCTAGSYWLIPAYGLDGAVYALMLSALVTLAGSVAILVSALRGAPTPAPATR